MHLHSVLAIVPLFCAMPLGAAIASDNTHEDPALVERATKPPVRVHAPYSAELIWS